MVHILSSKPSRAGRTGASLSAGIPRKTRRCPGVSSALAGTENGPIKLRSDLSNGEVRLHYVTKTSLYKLQFHHIRSSDTRRSAGPADKQSKPPVDLDLFGSQIQGDLIGAAQWRIYQGAAKEFGSVASDSSP